MKAGSLGISIKNPYKNEQEQQTKVTESGPFS